MNLWQLGVGVLWCALSVPVLPSAAEGPFVSVWPEKPVVEHGGSIMLNCSVSCKYNSTLGLETSLAKNMIASGPNWTAFELKNIRQWAPAPLCHASCQGKDVKPQQTNITVYRAPKSVVLDAFPPKMEVGKEYTLTCRVFDIAPIRNLTVTFFSGNKTLHQQMFQHHTAPVADNVTATHKITAQQSHHGKKFSCHAALRLEGLLIGNASLKQSMTTVGPPDQVTVELLKTSPNQSWAYNLSCHVLEVAPFSNLTVTLLKGTEGSYTQRYWNEAWENVTMTRAIIIQPQDYGQEATCHVTLDLGLTEQSIITISQTRNLKIYETYRAIIVASSSIAVLTFVLVGRSLAAICYALLSRTKNG